MIWQVAIGTASGKWRFRDTGSDSADKLAFLVHVLFHSWQGVDRCILSWLTINRCVAIKPAIFLFSSGSPYESGRR